MTVMPLTIGSFLVEDAVQTLIAHLRDNLNPALDAVYADYQAVEGANGVNLTHVAPSAYYISESLTPMMCPAVFVLSANTQFADNEAQLHVESRHDLLCSVLVEDVEETRLTKLTWRYIRAVYKAMHPRGQIDLSLPALQSMVAFPTQGAGVLQYVAGGVSYSPIFRRADGTKRFRKDATLRLRVLHHENF